MKDIVLIVAIVATLGPTSLACDVEDGDPEAARDEDAVVAQSRLAAQLALEDYLSCRAEASPECSTEEATLVAALGALEPEADDVGFRAGAVAACSGGGQITCNGQSCWAEDGVGCACTGSEGLSASASCAASN